MRNVNSYEEVFKQQLIERWTDGQKRHIVVSASPKEESPTNLAHFTKGIDNLHTRLGRSTHKILDPFDN